MVVCGLERRARGCPLRDNVNTAATRLSPCGPNLESARDNSGNEYGANARVPPSGLRHPRGYVRSASALFLRIGPYFRSRMTRSNDPRELNLDSQHCHSQYWLNGEGCIHLVPA